MANGVNKLKGKDNAIVVITHYHDSGCMNATILLDERYTRFQFESNVNDATSPSLRSRARKLSFHSK